MEWEELCRGQFLLGLSREGEASGLNLSVAGRHWSILSWGMIYSVYVLKQHLRHLHCDYSVRKEVWRAVRTELMVAWARMAPVGGVSSRVSAYLGDRVNRT